jgi:hypothetical protein
VDLHIYIDNAAISRLAWDELMETLDLEIETKKKEAVRVMKTARKEFGLEVGDGTNEQGQSDQAG